MFRYLHDRIISVLLKHSKRFYQKSKSTLTQSIGGCFKEFCYPGQQSPDPVLKKELEKLFQKQPRFADRLPSKGSYLLRLLDNNQHILHLIRQNNQKVVKTNFSTRIFWCKNQAASGYLCLANERFISVYWLAKYLLSGETLLGKVVNGLRCNNIKYVISSYKYMLFCAYP